MAKFEAVEGMEIGSLDGSVVCHGCRHRLDVPLDDSMTLPAVIDDRENRIRLHVYCPECAEESTEEYQRVRLERDPHHCPRVRGVDQDR